MMDSSVLLEACILSSMHSCSCYILHKWEVARVRLLQLFLCLIPIIVFGEMAFMYTLWKCFSGNIVADYVRVSKFEVQQHF